MAESQTSRGAGAIALTAAIVGLLCGGVGGFLLGKGSSRQNATSTRVPPPVKPVLTTRERDPEIDRLKDEVRRHEETIKSLRAERSSPKPAMTLKEKLAHAAMTYEAYRQLGTGASVDEKAYQRSLALAGALDKDMGPYFVEKYRASPQADPDILAMTLALQCGGAEVTDLLVERFNDPTATRMELNNLCRAMSGIDGWLTSFSDLVMNERVRETAERLMRSENHLDRRGGAGLLGIGPTEHGERLLREMAVNDVNFYVRAAAFRSIGRIGKGDSIEFLTTFLNKAENGEPNDENMKLREVLKAALAEAHRRQALSK